MTRLWCNDSRRTTETASTRLFLSEPRLEQTLPYYECVFNTPINHEPVTIHQDRSDAIQDNIDLKVVKEVNKRINEQIPHHLRSVQYHLHQEEVQNAQIRP